MHFRMYDGKEKNWVDVTKVYFDFKIDNLVGTGYIAYIERSV